MIVSMLVSMLVPNVPSSRHLVEQSTHRAFSVDGPTLIELAARARQPAIEEVVFS